MKVEPDLGRSGQLPDGQLPDGHLPDVCLSDSQRALVARLADGLTVAEAAALVGCSDRQARRQLRNVWDAMGARNRVQGMVRLALSGLIDWGDVETATDDGKDRRDIDRDPDTTEMTRGDGSP